MDNRDEEKAVQLDYCVVREMREGALGWTWLV